jgi:16S rRNA (guanine966-N2)-methyltransferase
VKGLRIVAGRWSGRRLDVVPGSRPSAERTREALFSIWQHRVEGAAFLDLFCASGAMGLEALSRGARAATLVDSDRRAIATATRNRERLEAAECRVVRASLPGGLAGAALGDPVFDLVFADPPYDFDRWPDLLVAIEPKLALEGEAAIEHAARAVLPLEGGELERADLRRYGDSAVTFYRRRRHARG